MGRLAILAWFGLLLGTGPVLAQDRYHWYHEGYRQAYPDNAEMLVRSWYQRYLHRTPDPTGEELGWVDALRTGQPPEKVLAGILGSQEYFTNAGGTPEAFVRALFMDLTGRQPTFQELNYWARRLNYSNPTDVAYDLLTRYPQSFSGAQPYFPDEHRYDVRRPAWPYYKYRQ
jgi:hypothetical protein